MEKSSEPINDIYWVPVSTIHFLSFSEGRPIQGEQDTRFLSEGNSAGEAKITLRHSPAFVDNYNDLPAEKRKRIQPFRFREGAIEKVLSCEHRFKNKDGDYTCGRPVHDIEDHEDRDDLSVNANGEFGMCCIERYSIPEGLGCPYEEKK